MYHLRQHLTTLMLTRSKPSTDDNGSNAPPGQRASAARHGRNAPSGRRVYGAAARTRAVTPSPGRHGTLPVATRMVLTTASIRETEEAAGRKRGMKITAFPGGHSAPSSPYPASTQGPTGGMLALFPCSMPTLFDHISGGNDACTSKMSII